MTQLLANGRPITFGTAGNYKAYAVTGWSQDVDQNDSTWLEGHVASLQFMFPILSTDCLLKATLLPLQSTKSRQQLLIYLNGLFVDLLVPLSQTIQESSSILRKEYFATNKDAINTITFVAPNAVSPLQEGLSQDQRTLSFCFMQITIQDATRPNR
jgi:hypothetical protein